MQPKYVPWGRLPERCLKWVGSIAGICKKLYFRTDHFMTFER
jgi:hypothetical protein